MEQAKPAPKVLFVHHLYSDEIQKAAAYLSGRCEAECFFESSPMSALARCLTLQPDVVLTHRLSPSDNRKFQATKETQLLFNEYFLGFDLFLEKFTSLPNNPLPRLIIVTRIDEHGHPLAFNFGKHDAIVSNYIMPPKDYRDILLAVQQTLYRRIEPIESN